MHDSIQGTLVPKLAPGYISKARHELKCGTCFKGYVRKGNQESSKLILTPYY